MTEETVFVILFIAGCAFAFVLGMICEDIRQDADRAVLKAEITRLRTALQQTRDLLERVMR